MTDQQKKDEAIMKAGKILIDAYDGFFGKITFNLQGNRKTVHSNVVQLVELEIQESKQL
jgi:hypothetical protein